MILSLFLCLSWWRYLLWPCARLEFSPACYRSPCLQCSHSRACLSPTKHGRPVPLLPLPAPPPCLFETTYFRFQAAHTIISLCVAGMVSRSRCTPLPPERRLVRSTRSPLHLKAWALFRSVLLCVATRKHGRSRNRSRSRIKRRRGQQQRTVLVVVLEAVVEGGHRRAAREGGEQQRRRRRR